MNTSGAILNFNLFGEDGDLPDVVHCETIETRSQLHDWEFAPHRHARLHQVLHLQTGAGHATLDGDHVSLGAGDLVNVPAGIVHGYAFDPGTQGHVVTFASEMLDESLRPSEGLRAVLSVPARLTIPEDVANTITHLADSFNRRDFARAQILRGYAQLLFGQLARALQQNVQAAPETSSEILDRFHALLDTHFLHHWSVADYAKALALSPTHLSRLTRAATGRPASALIEDRVIREARRNLVYTDMPVSRIAYALGYEDPAYFSRVFTRATGSSPRAFRQRLSHEAPPKNRAFTNPPR